MKKLIILIFSVYIFSQSSFDINFQNAVNAAKVGNYEYSNEYFTIALEQNRSCLSCIINISHNYLNLNKLDSAEIYFRLARQVNFTIETGNLAIQYYIKKRDLDSLCIYADKTDKLYSDLFKRYEQMQDTLKNDESKAEIDQQLQLYRNSFRQFIDVYEIYFNKNNVDYYLERAKLYSANTDSTKKYLEIAKNKFPNNLIIQNYLAEVYFFNKEYIKSINLYNELIINKNELKIQLINYLNIDQSKANQLILKLIKNKSICEYSLGNIECALITINNNSPHSLTKDYSELLFQKIIYLMELDIKNELKNLITDLEKINPDYSDLYYVKFILKLKSLNKKFAINILNNINSLSEKDLKIENIKKDNLFELLKILDKGKTSDKSSSIYLPNIYLFSSVIKYNLAWNDWCEDLNYSKKFDFEPSTKLFDSLCK